MAPQQSLKHRPATWIDGRVQCSSDVQNSIAREGTCIKRSVGSDYVLFESNCSTSI